MKTDDREPVTRIDEALDLLPRDIEPPRDLWPAIEARLEPRAASAGAVAGHGSRPQECCSSSAPR